MIGTLLQKGDLKLATIVNEEIVTGRVKRRLIDKAAKRWQRLSYWTKASDVEFNDGKTAEEKIGNINGISSDIDDESDNLAASMKVVSMLRQSFQDGYDAIIAKLIALGIDLNGDGTLDSVLNGIDTLMDNIKNHPNDFGISTAPKFKKFLFDSYGYGSYTYKGKSGYYLLSYTCPSDGDYTILCQFGSYQYEEHSDAGPSTKLVVAGKEQSFSGEYNKTMSLKQGDKIQAYIKGYNAFSVASGYLIVY